MVQANKQSVRDDVPRNDDLERAVLGAILLEPHGFDTARFLSKSDFYKDKHQAIFEAMVYFDQENTIPGEIELADRIEAMGHSASFGDELPFSYLMGLLNDTATARDLAYDARRLQDIAICRTLYLGAGPLVQAAYSKNADEALTTLEELAQSVRVKAAADDLKPVSSGLAAFIERLDYLHEHRGQVTGIPSGLTDLDRLLGGFQRSDLIILAARPAVGKTSLCLTLARNASIKNQKGIAVFSLEMSQEQLIQRLMSMEAGIDQQRLRNGWVEDDEWERIMMAMGTLNDVPLFIDDTPGISCVEIRSKVRRLIASGQKIDMIIVDYLQLMQAYPGSGTKKTENRVQEVSEISRQLKGLARELDVPVIALAQLSRAVESRQSKIPQLSDLRESGSIEQDSDVVMFIYRDDVYNPESTRQNIADIIVAKHRNGPVGEVSLFFKKSHTCFTDLEVTPPTDEEEY